MQRAREAQGGHSFGHSSAKSYTEDINPDGGMVNGVSTLNWSGREDSNLRPPGPEPEEDEESET